VGGPKNNPKSPICRRYPPSLQSHSHSHFLPLSLGAISLSDKNAIAIAQVWSCKRLKSIKLTQIRGQNFTAGQWEEEQGDRGDKAEEEAVKKLLVEHNKMYDVQKRISGATNVAYLTLGSMD